MIREQSQVIYKMSNYNKIASYIFIIFTGHLSFLIFLHKMNNDFDPLSLPPREKKMQSIQSGLWKFILNRHNSMLF